MDYSARAGSGNGSDSNKSGVEQVAARASTAAHNTVDKVADAARPVVDRLASGAHATVDKLADAASSAVGALGEKGEQLKATRERVVGKVGGYVRENPFKSLGIAVLASFVLSRLISLR